MDLYSGCHPLTIHCPIYTGLHRVQFCSFHVTFNGYNYLKQYKSKYPNTIWETKPCIMGENNKSQHFMTPNKV